MFLKHSATGKQFYCASCFRIIFSILCMVKDCMHCKGGGGGHTFVRTWNKFQKSSMEWSARILHQVWARSAIHIYYAWYKTYSYELVECTETQIRPKLGSDTCNCTETKNVYLFQSSWWQNRKTDIECSYFRSAQIIVKSEMRLNNSTW